VGDDGIEPGTAALQSGSPSRLSQLSHHIPFSLKILTIWQAWSKAGFKEGAHILVMKLGVIVYNAPIQKHLLGKGGGGDGALIMVL
jgi:hypothetical protein